MDCKHFVKVSPLIITRDDGCNAWSINEYHKWLLTNEITRYRGGNWPFTAEGMLQYSGEDITFKFDRIDDAMAFKLAWT